MLSKEKIYGAFKYKSYKDLVNKDWSKKAVDTTLLNINKKANKMIEEETGYCRVEIMLYSPKKMKWDLISIKMK